MTAQNPFSVLVLLGAIVVGMSWGRTEERCAASERDEQAEIQKLIEQLGQDNFKAREEAARKLKALGEKALQAVEKARNSEDAEVRRRAEVIAKDIQRAREERILREMLAKIEPVPVDQLIDQMATHKEFDTPENWERFHKLAETLTRLASRLGGKPWKLPELDYKKFPTVTELRGVSPDNRKVRVAGIPNRVTGINNCFVVSSGPIQRFTAMSGTILFVNGDLKGCMGIDNSFVFCNGNIGRITSIHNSIILATGDFTGSTTADNTFFQVKSVGRHARARLNVYLNLTDIRGALPQDNLYLISDKGPLQAVKFFDPARLGIEFSQAGEHVRIDKVHDGKLFSRASLRAGDIVLTADHEAIASPEDLRKFLRCRLDGEQFVLKVRRGDKTVESKAKMKTEPDPKGK
jgi:hypothetical protein